MCFSPYGLVGLPLRITATGMRLLIWFIRAQTQVFPEQGGSSFPFPDLPRKLSSVPFATFDWLATKARTVSREVNIIPQRK